MSNSVPSVVFRGISDKAGVGESETLSSSSSLRSLAATNAVRVSVAFIALLGRDGKHHDH